MKILICRLLIFIAALVIAASNLILNTKHGRVRGTDSLEEEVAAYLGIPYAEPPVGDLRFAKPLSKAPWTDTYNATSLSRPCVQHSFGDAYFLPDVSNMSEDCLYLNLWIPRKESTSGPRPVVVFIHGGAYVSGTASFNVYDGSRLASRGDIIVATLNYRVGAMGFFFGRTQEAPGNAGMYDQLMAITWIKDNAVTFGGDPDGLVLMGESAGAISISMLMVSSLSRHLFRRAILESGSAVHPYFNDDNAALRSSSRVLASLLRCSNRSVNLERDPRKVVECLKTKTPDAIVEAESVILRSKPISFYPRSGDAFLPLSTVDLYRSGQFRRDTSVLLGTNQDEGALVNILAFPEYFGSYGHQTSDVSSEARAGALLRAGTLLVRMRNVSHIVNDYLKNVKDHTSDGYLKMLADFWGDYGISCGTTFLADYLSLRGSHVYFYKFAFRAASTPMAEWVGVTHFDELQYVFGNPFHENFTEEEVRMSHLMMDRNPDTPSQIPWDPYTHRSKLYLHFGQEEESVRMNPDKRCEIWRSLFKSEMDPELVHRLRHSGSNETVLL